MNLSSISTKQEQGLSVVKQLATENHRKQSPTLSQSNEAIKKTETIPLILI